MDHRPQCLNLPTGAQESLVPLSDRHLQHHNLILQGSDVSGHHPDLDVEGITLTANQGDILLELLHMHQQWREVLTSLSHLLPSPCRIFTRLGLGFPGLRCLLPNRCMGDAELAHLGTLLG
jgi:hypothetical protein